MIDFVTDFMIDLAIDFMIDFAIDFVIDYEIERARSIFEYGIDNRKNDIDDRIE